MIFSLAAAFGVLPFKSLSQFKNLNISQYQAALFPGIFQGFPKDIPGFFGWLSFADPLALFKTQTPEELAVGNLESGKSKIVKPEREFPRVDTLAEAEALDNAAEEKISSSFSAKSTDTEDKQDEIATDSNFILFENPLSPF